MSETSIFRPFGDRIYVQLISEPEGVIKTPEGSRPRPNKGLVLSCGDGAFNESGILIPMRCKPDDVVLFGKYAGTDITLDEDSEENFLCMREEEVIGWLDIIPSKEETAASEPETSPVSYSDNHLDGLDG